MATAVAAIVPTAMAAQSETAKALAGKPLTGSELTQLYRNRTWIWDHGGGYFAAKDNTFNAWSGKGSSASYGEGVWFTASGGRLCFDAEWHSAQGNAPALTCFSHREKNGVIYQRREPAGAWYIFKHARVKHDDAYLKLQLGDRVAGHIPRIKERLASN
ncbi:DUF995 domain-containing protein [Methylovirgula sp. 4M-Z18]|nr:DUF995 domain-containing protein [Methylovirgula sp. 4M-Z18]